MSDAEFDAHVSDQENAPACGSCLLLADHLRYIVSVILAACGGRVFPKVPRQAYSQLIQTRWPHHVDLEEFLSRDLDDLKYERINYEMDPERIKEGMAQFQEAAERTRQRRETIRAAQAQGELEDETDG